LKHRNYMTIAVVVSVSALSFLFDDLARSSIAYLKHPLLDIFFIWLSSALLSILLMISLMSIAMKEDGKSKWIIPLWLSAFFAIAIAEILKLVFLRDRPEGAVLTLLLIKDFSFPSAHAAICFSLVPILEREYRHFRFFWIGFACLVAFSRIYLGVHYLSDVVVGGFLGYFIGLGMIEVSRRWRSLS
jgi:undecaprenyl-diphosphatase